LAIKETDAIKIADAVSSGCSGASQRFFKVARILMKVGIDSKNALKNAVKFAKSDDGRTDAFVELFRQTYNPDYLDLDALNSLRISLRLSVDFDGTIEHSLADFKELVEYCKDKNKLDLPIPQCAKMAAKVTKLGQDYEEQIAGPFIKLVTFISDLRKGPQTDKNSAIKIATDVIANGPIASENFIDAYRYAVSKKGLKMTEVQAINFAKKMAKRSFKLESKL
jgi:hypothetical protein